MNLKDRILIINRHLFEDSRGWFLKVITGKEDNLPMYTGEIYLTMAKPGEIKGEHYHPKAFEWFTVINGSSLLKLEDIDSKEKLNIFLKFEDHTTIFIPNNIAHSFTNIGNNDLIILAYTNELYNPNDTIQYILE